MNEASHDQAFEDLLEYLKASRAFDFTGYKRASLMRRVERRMQDLPDVQSYAEYRDYLEVHPDEFVPLFNTILINVSDFFRDQLAWDYLAENILPELVGGEHEPIRICSVGCAHGQEAYSIAMLLAEQLGPEQYKRRVKVFATDVDEEALAIARHAIYPAAALKSVPAEFKDKYFDPGPGNQMTFKTEIRRSVIFGRHDLVQDAPISRLDLLICRNTLMYFNAETQARALARFNFALNDGGYLFLGKAEMLIHDGSLFTPVDLKYRVFSKISGQSVRDRALAFGPANADEAAGQLIYQLLLREVAFDGLPIAQIVVDVEGKLVLASGAAREMFGLAPNDIGQSLSDLALSYRPLELRSIIDQAVAERRTVVVPKVSLRGRDGETEYLDVQVAPLYDDGNRRLGVMVMFIDITTPHNLQEKLEQANQEMETANEELQSANEELETTNEELQSTNEELETTNEELQSTNEELETMNEELQATNEELQTTNDELNLRSDEVVQLNGFLQSIMGSLRGALAVVDRKSIVLAWNRRAEDLWGVPPGEAQGQSIFSLDIGLPVAQLKEHIRATLDGGAEPAKVTVGAINRRGKAIQCRVTFAPLSTGGNQVEGVIIAMENSTEGS